MPSPGTICSLLLLSVLCVDLAMAGVSFLSPEQQKVQRKESKKPPAKLQPRELEGWLRPEDGTEAEGAEDELAIRMRHGSQGSPSGRLKLASQPTVTMLPFKGTCHPVLASRSPDRRSTVPKKSVQFNTPFDVGIKMSGAQDHRHGQALGKFLQDMFWEEAHEAPADK